jgi:hypothetical protein
MKLKNGRSINTIHILQTKYITAYSLIHIL